jgi:hypothetical protein
VWKGKPVSPEPQTNLIGARVAVLSKNYAHDPAHHRYGVLRGIVPVDQYHVTYLIQLDVPEQLARIGNDFRALYRICEIGSTDESCYVALDPQHPGTCAPNLGEEQSLAEMLGTIEEALSPEHLQRITAEFTIEQQVLIVKMFGIAAKLRNRQP